MRPAEALLVDLVRHSPEMRDVLAVLVTEDMPHSFTRIVHEIRLRRATAIGANSAAHLTAVGLGILFIGGLVRTKREGFVATEAGHEVQLRLQKAPSALRLAEPVQIHEIETTAREGTNPMNHDNIIMTTADHAELSSVVALNGKISSRMKFEMRLLENELGRAKIVQPEELPQDAVTMNSRVGLMDLASKERMEFTLVLPRDAEIDQGKISVLTPLGTAMLGYRVGDEFDWHVPYGIRRLKVTNVYFQPGAEWKKAA
jgi:regulator of nucleoside diphosphate kinase